MTKDRFKSIAKFVIRWGIAVAGFAYVISQMTLRDHVTILDDANRPVKATLVEAGDPDARSFEIYDPETDEIRTVARGDLVNDAHHDSVRIMIDGEPTAVDLLALRLSGDLNRSPRVERLLIEDPQTLQGRWIAPDEVVGGYKLAFPQPIVETGLIALVQNANPFLLIAAVAIFPVTFLLTSVRWHRLVRALDIPLTLGRAFVLNMVGAFYNTFMPGVTGGDLLKAYYASKLTDQRTAAVLSVVVDRVLGLMTLLLIGGTMAGIEWFTSPSRDDPAARASLQVALLSLAIFIAAIVGGWLFLHTETRKRLGLDFLIGKAPMQKQVRNAAEVARAYRSRPMLIVWAMLVTMPVHITVILSAMLAGNAFDLPLSASYYFVAVPVIVLSGSMPISPQGAGVMEFFAVMLTQRQGATVSQAFALAMSIRLVQVMWNLTGGIFVARGGFHTPPAEELAGDDDEPSPETSARSGAAAPA